MKKAIVFILMTCILFSAVGCSSTKPSEKIFSIESYNLQIKADNTFSEKTAGDFDLQITNDKCYISIMAFEYIDLPNDLTPSDVYDMQNDDIFSRRSNVTTIEETKSESFSNRTITKALYSAEKDGIKNYYATYLIDLPEDEVFAWVMITAMPSYLSDNQEYLNNIASSLTTIK